MERANGNYKNYKIISMGPPSSGGVLLMQMLKMAEQFPLNSINSTQRVDSYYDRKEKRSFADRAEYLGDPDL